MQTQAQAEFGASTPSAIHLDADLGIDTVHALHERLDAHLGDEDLVSLNAAEVERVHSAALQLFCLFCRDRRAAGREVSFLKPSDALRSAAALLGATTILNLAKVSHESGQ